MDGAAGAGEVGFELLEVLVEALHGAAADGFAGGAESLPVGHLADDAGAFGLDDVGGVADVVAELLVFEGGGGGGGEGWGGHGVQGVGDAD